MVERLTRLLAYGQLTRIALVYTAVSNIYMIGLFSRAHGLGPSAANGQLTPSTGLMLACATAVAVGMYVFGMTLNDIMDVRRDRTFAPDRPIPAGAVSPAGASAIAIGALLLAVAGSVPLGREPTFMCLLCAVMVLFYDGMGKHVPWVGLITLGLIRATHMLIVNPSLSYCWPIWLTMSHVIGISTAAYRLEGKRPPLTGRDIWCVTGAWAFLTMLLLAWMNSRGALNLPGKPWLWVGPVAAVCMFVPVAIRMVRTAESERAAGGLLIKWGLLWLIVYDAAWLAASKLWWQAALVAALLPMALGTMALMRHLKLALNAPSGFRRDP